MATMAISDKGAGVPHKLTLSAFCEKAKAKRSETYYMEWEIYLDGRLCGIEVAENEHDAKREVHKKSIQAALSSNTGYIKHLYKLDLPGLHVMADYPELQKQYQDVLKQCIFGKEFSLEELEGCHIAVDKLFYPAENILLDVMRFDAGNEGTCEAIIRVAEKRNWLLNGIVFAGNYCMNFVKVNEEWQVPIAHDEPVCV